jgi:hypothetical protein
MADYRVFFLDAGNAIQARDEFQVDTDAAAITIADWVFEACSEKYAGYELWCGTRRLMPLAQTDRGRRDFSRPEDISLSIQQIIADREHVLLDSAWSVSRSRKLIQAAKDLQDHLNSRAARS